MATSDRDPRQWRRSHESDKNARIDSLVTRRYAAFPIMRRIFPTLESEGDQTRPARSESDVDFLSDTLRLAQTAVFPSKVRKVSRVGQNRAAGNSEIEIMSGRKRKREREREREREQPGNFLSSANCSRGIPRCRRAA